MLDDVEGENGIRVLNSWLKVLVRNQKTSIMALKVTFIFCSQRIEISKNKIQNLILWMAKLQWKFNSNFSGSFRELIRKEWDSGIWEEGIYTNSNTAEDFEDPNFCSFLLTLRARFLLFSEISHLLSKVIVKRSLIFRALLILLEAYYHHLSLLLTL